MANTFVKTFGDQDAAATWAAVMHEQGYAVALSNACDDVGLIKADGTPWANPPVRPNGYFVVMAFNRAA